jgi:cysteine-rich repeat protein
MCCVQGAKLACLVLVAMLTPGLAAAQIADHRGTEFIFGYIPDKDNEGPVSLSLQVLSDAASNVTVEHPLGTQITNFATTPDSVFGVSIPLAAHNNWAGEAVTNNAVRITATTPVSVVTRTTGFGANDRKLVLPLDVLGTEYIIMSKPPGQFFGGEYVVVANQNSTSVQINGGTPIVLNRGQGFLRTGNNVAGTIITANKSVSVTNGNKCASVPTGINFCEHMTEFAVPTSEWGVQILARNMPNQNLTSGLRSTLYRIAASQNGTTVNLNGALLGNLSRGGVLEVTRSGGQFANYFSANNPILVAEYSNSICDEWPSSAACTGGFPQSREHGDASMVTLLPIAGYVKRSTFSGAERINVIALTTDAQNSRVLLDGVPISPGDFSSFPSLTSYSHAVVPVSTTGFHSIESPNGHSATAVLLLTFSTESWPAAMQFEPVVPSVCGNGSVEVSEQCDDGGTLPGDCCSPTCQFESVAIECRASAGVCDAAEMCPGTAGTCPADGFLSSSVECRPGADICDLAEMCTGSSASCPGDVFEPPTTECRVAAGLCDAPELCPGGSPSCPADVFQPSGFLCRPSAGACDVTETCVGSSPNCPTDLFEPPGLECRPSAGVCDVVENCTGGSGLCPVDGFEPNGTACDDLDACTVPDVCTSGACVGTASGDADIDGVCDAVDNCPVLPNPLQENSDPLFAGDACQCGDLSDNGVVDAADLEIAQKHLVQDEIFVTFDIKRCNVIGPSNEGFSDCDVRDLFVLDSYLSGGSATIQNVCFAYTGM